MIKDSIIYFLSKFLPAILSFIILFLYLEFLSPEDYGLFSLVIVSAGLINILSSQWIRSSYLRYRHTNQNSNMYFSLQILVIFLTLFILNVSFIFLDISLVIKIFLNIIVILITLNDYYINYFRTNIQPLIVLWGTLIKNIIYILLLCIFIFFNRELTTVLSLLAFLTGLLVAILFYNIFIKSKQFYKIDKKKVKTSLRYGLPITISFALGVFLQNIDKFMITYTLGLEENGNYSMGFDLMHNSFYMIMSALAMASLPRILKYNMDKNLNTSFEKYINLFLIIVIPFFATLFLTTEDLSEIFSHHNYDINSSLILFILLATLFHGIKSFIYDQALQLLEKTAFIFIPSIIAVIINIIINFLFLEQHGVIVAAISSLIAFFISTIITGVYLKKYIIIKIDVFLIFYNFIILVILFISNINLELNNVYINFVGKASIVFIIFSLFNGLYIYFKENFIWKKI